MLREKECIAKKFRVELYETNEVMELIKYYPDLIDSAKKIALENGGQFDFWSIIEAYVNNVKNSIDYSRLSNYSKIRDELKDFIDCIEIGNKGIDWYDIEYCDINSRFFEIANKFRLLVSRNISLEDFYTECTAILSRVLDK